MTHRAWETLPSKVKCFLIYSVSIFNQNQFGIEVFGSMKNDLERKPKKATSKKRAKRKQLRSLWMSVF